MTKRKNLDEPLHWYSWHYKDYRASRQVARMNYIQRGLYRELLDECWDIGYIVDDVDQLAQLTECPLEEFKLHWPVIRKAFVEREPGFLINEKLDRQRTEQDVMRIKRSMAGQQSHKSVHQVTADDHQVLSIANQNRIVQNSTEQNSNSIGAVAPPSTHPSSQDYQEKIKGLWDVWNSLTQKEPRLKARVMNEGCLNTVLGYAQNGNYSIQDYLNAALDAIKQTPNEITDTFTPELMYVLKPEVAFKWASKLPPPPYTPPPPRNDPEAIQAVQRALEAQERRRQEAEAREAEIVARRKAQAQGVN